MLLQQFSRVKEIDAQISDLHQHLARLYDERAGLVGFLDGTPLTLPEEPSAAASALSPKSLYTQLKTAWQTHGVPLPAQRSLQKQLTKAIDLIEELTAENPQLSGQLQVVAVPPFKALNELVASRSQLFQFAEPEPSIMKTAKKSQVWSLVVVVNPQFSAEVTNMQLFMGNGDYRYKAHDCRGLGVQELLAAELQGVHLQTPGSWTLLLKDAREGRGIPCVMATESGKLIFDIDETNGLLGRNYFRPAIAV